MSNLRSENVRQISEEFTIAARLHYEAVIVWATNFGEHPKHAQLGDIAQKALKRAEELALKFDEHVQGLHRMTSPASQE